MVTSPTYKQLEARLKISGFTLHQWTEMCIAAMIAMLFGLYVSPFGVATTLFLSILLAGAPVALSYGAMSQEWSVLDALSAQWHWLTRPRRRLPGPGVETAGYRVTYLPVARDEGDGDVAERHDEGSAGRGKLWDF